MTATHVRYMNLKKATLATALAVSLGAASGLAQAVTYDFDIKGAFTMLGATGALTKNTAKAAYVAPWYGQRTAITGTMHYDTAAGGAGTMTIPPFLFFGDSPQFDAAATGVTFRAIGDGNGGAGTLLLANMGFDWNLTVGIPVSIVWDGQGLLSALPALTCSSTSLNIVGVGALAATDGAIAKGINMVLGASPIVTTTWNTTTLPGVILGSNPSGGLPLIADTIGGSPMVTAPFQGFNANFDFISLTLNAYNGVPCVVDIALSGTSPAANAVGVPVTSPISISFNTAMTDPSIVNLSNFKVAPTSNPTATVAGTIIPSGTVATFTPTANLAYSTQYTVTFSAPVTGRTPAVLTTQSWSFTTRDKPVDVLSCTTDPRKPLGNNFTMLTPASIGAPTGGANDVVFTWDNHISPDISDRPLNHVSISSNTVFRSFPWTAHHIRIFDVGTYIINTACSTGDLDNGTCTPNSDDTKNYHVTVKSGEFGVHILFDWNGTTNIDVINIWKKNGQWVDPNGFGQGADKNNLYQENWSGPAGLQNNPNTVWKYVSTDVDNDGINGLPMIDGPFVGFNANFNIEASDTCLAVPPRVSEAPGTQLGGGGCSLSATPVNPLERGDWWLIAGFIAWMGLVVRRKRA